MAQETTGTPQENRNGGSEPPRLPLAATGTEAVPPPATPQNRPTENRPTDRPPPLPGQQTGNLSRRLAAVGTETATPATKARPEPERLLPPPDEADSSPQDGAAPSSGRRTARRRAAGPSRPNKAANDDVPSIGGLIFALHQKPSERPLQIAAVASVVWAVLGILLGWAMLAPELQRAPTLLEMLQRPTAITLAATILIPIALFWFMAHLVWRAQELKLMSSAMTEVAIRLAEPDRMAEQQIASVGQAVRRQVSFMNEAVSRALGRAGELEALVHNEVSNLEQSYTQNEHRIRNLLQELSGERHALLNTSERVNVSLKELSSHIPSLIDKLGEQQVKLAKFIENAGQNLVAMEATLETSTTNLAGAIGSRTQELQTLLTDRTDQMQTVLYTFSEGLNTALGSRTEGLQTVLEEYTRALDSTLQGRQQSLDTQLVERTKALDEAFSERLRLFDESVVRTTIAIDSTVADKARALSSALENHAKEIGQVLGRQAGELDEQIMHGVHAVRRASENVTRHSIKAIEGLAGQADLLRNVSENLVNQISSVSNRFDQQGQTILKAANALETANYRIDKTLQNRQAELSQTLERLSGKAADIDQVMRGYSASLEGTISEAETRAISVGERLTRGAEEHSRAALDEFERLQSVASGETERALADLKAKFSSMSREVSEEIGTLSSRFSDTSDEMRSRARRTLAEIEDEQARLKEQLDRLPEATRASAETMRSSLQEQLRALEQLSSLSSRAVTRNEIMPPVAPQQQASLQQASLPSAGRSISSVTQSLANEMASRTRPQPEPAAQPAQPHSPPPATANALQRTSPVAEGIETPAGEAGRDGWSLGDLLARASQDEDSSRQPLNIANIARALDATTASAIWSRFRVGQRGVMVRSIYTAEGRIAFDEVQRRTKSEAEFRQSVERYILDFEQLLRDADQRDPSGRAAQSYVVSDSGRVYLFLAHACGRLA